MIQSFVQLWRDTACGKRAYIHRLLRGETVHISQEGGSVGVKAEVF